MAAIINTVRINRNNEILFNLVLASHSLYLFQKMFMSWVHVETNHLYQFVIPGGEYPNIFISVALIATQAGNTSRKTRNHREIVYDIQA